MVQQGSLAAAESALKDGLNYLRSGKFKTGRSRIPFKSSYSRNPADVLGAATSSYIRAVNNLARAEEPGDDAKAADTQRYENVISRLEALRTELVDYAKEAAMKVDKQAADYVSRAERLVRQEASGRKILGVPYARRPRSEKVEKEISKAGERVQGAMTITPQDDPTGKTYLTRLQGDLKAIQTDLERASLLTDAEGKYLAEVKHNFIEYSNSLDEAAWAHRANVGARSAAASQRRTEREERKDERSASKLRKRGAKEERRHLRELGKRKW